MRLTIILFALASFAMAQTLSTVLVDVDRFETQEMLPAAATQMCQASNATVTRTSGTVLSLGATASASAPVSYRFDYRSRQQAAANTLTITAGSGSGTATIYASLIAGALTLGVVHNTGNTLTCTGATACSTAEAGSAAAVAAARGMAIWSWRATAGAWDVGGGTQLSLSRDCWIDQVWLANITGSAVTVGLANGRGVPFVVLQTATIPAYSTTLITAPGGAAFEAGLLLTSGTASAVNVIVRGARARPTAVLRTASILRKSRPTRTGMPRLNRRIRARGPIQGWP